MKNTIACLSLFLCTSLYSQTNDRANIIKAGFDFAAEQLTLAMQETERVKEKTAPERKNKYPLVAPRTTNPNGNLHLVTSDDWTSGFFAGELWLMYEYTQDPKWEKAARLYTAPLEREKFTRNTHDMGFKMYCSFGNGYRLTKDENYKNILLQSAYTLITRYNPKVKAIRSWDFNREQWQYPVIIDNMMNLELLFWAFKESRDSTFFHVAVNHANTTLKNHFRKDNSSYHVVSYDTITGQVEKKNTHQGYADESAWARGQAWGAYGFTMCYRETRNPDYLQQAANIVNFIFTNPNLPEDLIPYWDYNAPGIPFEPRDVSAAACLSSALYELSLYDETKAAQYKKWADTIVENLTKNYRATLGQDRGFLLLHSVGAKPSNSEVDVPLVYADYYYLEALLRKQQYPY
ncbi:MAG: glycoside hydrolase family 88 protein [Dysgonamonadaceae bacterium]|jgi:rhamnogalacturonyl hydrolase YesR|nr:glycoside hydrolase family 88 protein [Dysgonamonadaceae bacterium]